MIELNEESDLKRELVEEAKVETSFMKLDEDNCLIGSQLEAMVESCFFDESINEFDMNIVSMV